MYIYINILIIYRKKNFASASRAASFFCHSLSEKIHPKVPACPMAQQKNQKIHSARKMWLSKK